MKDHRFATSYLRRLPLYLGLLSSVSLFSCSLPAGLDSSLSMDQYKALQCKTIIERLATGQGSEAVITSNMIENAPQCPAATEPTYSQSMKAAEGKLCSQAEILCSGDHHKKAGYPSDYPRYLPGKGVVESPEGTIAVPSGLALPLPEKVTVLSTGGERSTISVTFSTEEPLEPLATRYYKMLNNGQEPVLAGRLVDSGVSGKSGSLSYSVRFDEAQGVVIISWEPPIIEK